MKGYPRKFQTVLVVIFAALAATGALLILTVLDLRFGLDVAWRLSGSQRLWVVGLHTGTAFVLCCLAGAIWSIHMRVGWHGGRHILSGLITAALLAVAMLSALGIFYFGEETWLVSASAAHTLVGLAGVVGGGLHWASVVIERARRAGQRVEPDPSASAKPRLHLVRASEEREAVQ